MKDSNRLIAEFMGHNLGLDSQGEPQSRIYENGLGSINLKDAYSTWDWLMPVVAKCLDVYHIEQMNDDLNFKFYDSMGDIKATYKAVVEFIKKQNKD